MSSAAVPDKNLPITIDIDSAAPAVDLTAALAALLISIAEQEQQTTEDAA